MRYVLHDAVHRPEKEFLVLVVHRYDDEFSVTTRVVEDLAEGEPIECDAVRVRGGGGRTHTRELAIGAECAYVE